MLIIVYYKLHRLIVFPSLISLCYENMVENCTIIFYCFCIIFFLCLHVLNIPITAGRSYSGKLLLVHQSNRQTENKTYFLKKRNKDLSLLFADEAKPKFSSWVDWSNNCKNFDPVFLIVGTCYHFLCQPVQGFDYAKKHMGRTGDEAISVTKDTLVLGLPVRDAPLSLSLDKKVHQDGTASKRPPSADIHKGG